MTGAQNRSICVFCSSSDGIEPAYFAVAEELGARLAKDGLELVYGGASVGLMGALARSVHRHGGRVVGVLPEALQTKEIAYPDADEFIVTRDLRERKAIMETRAGAFIALPGGFGTLEETVEMLTLKQLGLHNKAIVFLNALGFWDPLLELFEHMYRTRFAKPEYRGLYSVANSVDEALNAIGNYVPPALGTKWY
jgi:uncharacterized protein (TIGR00730 family)